jgi:hypothetical protein
MRLHEFYGKNFTIPYRSAYKFNEEWENQISNVYDKSEL